MKKENLCWFCKHNAKVKIKINYCTYCFCYDCKIKLRLLLEAMKELIK